MPASPVPVADVTDTRSALIDAAADVFAEVGFHHARVRDICQRAGANIAAVNYHFGDKETLYAEVLKESFARVKARFPLDQGVEPGATPEAKLEAFVRAYFRRIFACNGDSRHSRMILREMIEPTAGLDELVRHVVHPSAAVLDGIMADLLGPAVPPEQRRLCAMSVIGQALFYIHCQPVLKRAFPELRIDEGAIDTLCAHVTAFSLAGAAAMRAAAEKPAQKRG